MMKNVFERLKAVDAVIGFKSVCGKAILFTCRNTGKWMASTWSENENFHDSFQAIASEPEQALEELERWAVSYARKRIENAPADKVKTMRDAFSKALRQMEEAKNPKPPR
jgi:hypothetical protein